MVQLILNFDNRIEQTAKNKLKTIIETNNLSNVNS